MGGKKRSKIYFKCLAFWVSTTASSSDEVDKLGKGEFSNNAVGSTTDLFGDGVLVVSQFLVEVGLQCAGKLFPVNWRSSNDEGGRKVNVDGVEADGFEVKVGDLDFVSDDVDEKRSTSLKNNIGGPQLSKTSSGKISRGDGGLTEWTGINVSVGGEVSGSVNSWDGNLEGGGEEESVDVDLVTEGG